ncbi:MAG: hypothetical protein GWN73_39650, partial [Actinobacteria bacterium]|nr:hypothetical protein [Actinomycetota bacterium]NIS36667.1 hypothetical protein [Actinomycetota bacterium]NIU71157.1 hypothetical protein [Actinomycetota bacterium]NIW33113.1 hypothetical protein [Actinomycetota bacterium]
MTTGAQSQGGGFIRRVGDEVLAVVRTQEATSYDGVAIAWLGSQDFVYVALDAATGDVLRATPFGSSSRDSVFS